MTPFTYDDLKQLKYWLGESTNWEDFSSICSLGPKDILNLLARLEASESLLNDINYDVFACDDGLLEGWKIWRKAVGR